MSQSRVLQLVLKALMQGCERVLGKVASGSGKLARCSEVLLLSSVVT